MSSNLMSTFSRYLAQRCRRSVTGSLPAFAVVFCALLSLGSDVAAQPWAVSTLPSASALTDVAHGGGAVVGATSNTVDTTNLFAPLRGQVFVSRDRGTTFTDISGSLATETVAEAVDALALRGPERLWISRGEAVLRTDDGGGSWTSSPSPGRLRDLHFFSSDSGIGVGEGGVIATTVDGGATWTAMPSPTEVTLRGMFWLDASTGWAWGHDEVDVDVDRGGGSELAIEGGVLITSADKGASWHVVSTFDGVHVGPAYFTTPLDGQLGLATPASDEGRDAVASLQRTSDGGIIWSMMELPIVVGSMDVPFGGPEPIEASYVRAMHWEGTRYGHVVAVAHLWDAEVSSSGGSGPSSQDASGWRVVDYMTEDGGDSWAFTDLGEVEVSFSFEGVEGESDGFVAAGLLIDQYRGWLATWDGTVLRHEAICSAESSCRGGYECRDGACSVPEDGVPNTVRTGDDGEGEYPEGSGDTAPRPPRQAPTGDGAAANADGGCMAAAGGGHQGLTFVALAFVCLGRRHRSSD